VGKKSEKIETIEAEAVAECRSRSNRAYHNGHLLCSTSVLSEEQLLQKVAATFTPHRSPPP
jgi:hypothetical protein